MVWYQPLGGISHIRLTLELVIRDQLPPIVKLNSGEINVRAIENPVNGQQRNINPLAPNSDVLQRCMFGWGGPPVQLRPESRHILGVELLHHFFAIAAHISSRPLQPMSGEYRMDGRHSGNTPSEKPLLECQGPGYDPPVVRHLDINIYLILTLDTYWLG